MDGFHEYVGVISIIDIDNLKLTHPAPCCSETHNSSDLGFNYNGGCYRGLEGGLRGGSRGRDRRWFSLGSHRGEESGGRGEALDARVVRLPSEGALAARQLAAVEDGGVVRVGEGVLAAGDRPRHSVVRVPLPADAPGGDGGHGGGVG